MPIQKDLTRPSLAIVLVIDKSGSMSGTKIQLAKRAAVATADAINPRDLIGVIGFDGDARVLLELTPASDRGTVSSRIAQLEAGGGTFLFPALQQAREQLLGSNARRKHVVVLSDGQTQGYGYEDFVNLMSADSISLSTVGIGEGADMDLLQAMALAGGGRAYFTNDFFSIPQIFTKEALRASKSMLVERLVQPIRLADDPCLRGIDADGLPFLTGYVATTARPAARTILVSDTGDPLLARWRFGLGQTAAFTSETKPRWAEDWIDWPDFAKFWSQLVRGIAGAELGKTISIVGRHTREGDRVRLVADARTASGAFVDDIDIRLTARDGQGALTELPVEQVAPGLFEAEMSLSDENPDHQFAWRWSTPEGEADVTSYGITYACSPEFQTLGANEVWFDSLAVGEETGNARHHVGHAQLSLAQQGAPGWQPLWPYLLAAGLLLAPIDILVRRMG
jgi:uncharacterized protein YegL